MQGFSITACRPIDKLLILNSIVFAFDRNRFSSVARGRLRPKLTLYCKAMLNLPRCLIVEWKKTKDYTQSRSKRTYLATSAGSSCTSRQRNLRLARKDEVRTYQPLSSDNKRTESNPSGLPRFSDLENVQPLSI